MEINVETINKLEVREYLFDRYWEIARLITGHPKASIHDGVDWVSELTAKLNIPGLHQMGIKKRIYQRLFRNRLPFQA